MDLHSGLPYSLIKNGLPYNYPKLEESSSSEVVVVGGGISGALMAYYLTRAGIDSIVVDSRTIGLGSTASSTSLLQYEIDVPLCELIVRKGTKDAVRSFILCKDAINKLKTISASIGSCTFKDMKSLYFADNKKNVQFLKKEFDARRSAGFNVQFLNEQDINTLYGLHSPAGILSANAGQMDAYAFTHALLQYCISKGLKVFDRTTVKRIAYTSNQLKLTTENGSVITAKKMINATGYEVLNFIDENIVKLKSTYVVISEHIAKHRSLNNDTLFWNTADPYLYMSFLDGRIIIGGRDESYYNPVKRDKLINAKSRQLTNDFVRLFPKVPFKPEFRWTGTFGSTKDGLPFIGTLKRQKNVYYALGFGGNGITFSVIAAQIISDLILGKPNADASVFSFDRV
jgi:glycine/D-amino acid oxidase-like deaminating enzyme